MYSMPFQPFATKTNLLPLRKLPQLIQVHRVVECINGARYTRAPIQINMDPKWSGKTTYDPDRYWFCMK